MKSSFDSKYLSLTRLPWATAAQFLLLLSATGAWADWPGTNLTKWVQFPDRTGYDVLAAQTPGALPIVVADDFQCRKTGPITDIHIWASWLGDNPDPTSPSRSGSGATFPR